MAGTNYISPEGLLKLRTEYDELRKVERPRVVQEVADAAAQGDRSENAEYIYGKRRLREIDRRMHVRRDQRRLVEGARHHAGIQRCDCRGWHDRRHVSPRSHDA